VAVSRGPRGFLPCRIECAGEDAKYVIETLRNKHGRVIDGLAYCNGHVQWLIDLSTIPDGEGRLVEAVVRADAQKAISLHTVLP
jgi:hypothetical protein